MPDELSPEIRAKRAADARRYVYDGIPSDIQNPAGKQAYLEYIEFYKQEWEKEFGRPWTEGSPQRRFKQWTPDQEARIRARVQPQVDALAQQFELDPQDKENWAEWAQSLYEIDNGRVTSYAKEDMGRKGQPQTWQYNSEDKAEEQVEKLILWKINDRKRNRGDINRDLGGPSQL